MLCIGMLIAFGACGDTKPANDKEMKTRKTEEATLVATSTTSCLDESRTTQQVLKTTETVTTTCETTSEKETTEKTEGTNKTAVKPHIVVKTEKTTNNIRTTVKPKTKATTKATTKAKAKPTTKATTVSTTAAFDIDYWVQYAKDKAIENGYTLDPSCTGTWDTPIVCHARCKYIARDINDSYAFYKKTEPDLTSFWIWYEETSPGVYELYMGRG